VADLVLHRWTQFGYDRLYIDEPLGTRLGYVDLKTNELHPVEPEVMGDLATAAADYLSRPRRQRSRAPRVPVRSVMGRHEQHK
jgi:hypothetical protein